MDSLQGLALGLARRLHLIVHLLSEEWHIQCATRVLFLAMAPLSVFIIESSPVVVDVFVELDVADGERREASFDLLADPAAKDSQEDQEEYTKDHRPERALPSATSKEDEHLVIRVCNGLHIGPRIEVLVAKELLIGSHPVSEEHQENGRRLEAVKNVL